MFRFLQLSIEKQFSGEKKLFFMIGKGNNGRCWAPDPKEGRRLVIANLGLGLYLLTRALSQLTLTLTHSNHQPDFIK